MDIFPDWLGQTGGAGMPYPVLVQGLSVTVSEQIIYATIEEEPEAIVVPADDTSATVELAERVDVTITPNEIDVELCDE